MDMAGKRTAQSLMAMGMSKKEVSKVTALSTLELEGLASSGEEANS